MPILDGSTIQTLAPIPAGTYPAVFKEQTYQQAKSSDNFMHVCVFEISEGEYEGRKFFLNLVLKDNSLWKLKETCMALGTDEEVFSGEFDSDEVLDECLDRACRIEVETQKGGEYAGRNSLKRVLAPGFNLDD